MYFRLLGLSALNGLLDSSFKFLIYSFKSLSGILSSCIVKSLEDEVETAFALKIFNNYPLRNLLIHLVNLYKELIEMVSNSNDIKQVKLSAFNGSCGIGDLGDCKIDKVDKFIIKNPRNDKKAGAENIEEEKQKNLKEKVLLKKNSINEKY